MWRCIFVLVAACNQVWELHETRARDAAPTDLPDEDADGVIDLQDNCAMIANADQADSDGDRRGDVCDDCPLVVNAPGADADGDRLGDRCDPHPAQAGDCVLMIDTFSDPSTFADHWKQAPPGIATPRFGSVRLEPMPGAADLQLVASTVTDATDIVVRGTLDATSPNTAATVTAVLGTNKTTVPYRCQLTTPNLMIVEGPGGAFPSFETLVPSTTVSHDFVLRFSALTVGGTNLIDISCRVDYGISVGTDISRGEPPAPGGPAIHAGGGPSTLDAVALMRFQPGKACPATIYR